MAVRLFCVAILLALWYVDEMELSLALPQSIGIRKCAVRKPIISNSASSNKIRKKQSLPLNVSGYTRASLFELRLREWDVLFTE
jgi:hypothetical protein